jgi:hypothetical protein
MKQYENAEFKTTNLGVGSSNLPERANISFRPKFASLIGSTGAGQRPGASVASLGAFEVPDLRPRAISIGIKKKSFLRRPFA